MEYIIIQINIRILIIFKAEIYRFIRIIISFRKYIDSLDAIYQKSYFIHNLYYIIIGYRFKMVVSISKVGFIHTRNIYHGLHFYS